MESVACKVCFQNYSETQDRRPKILNCGHSLCAQCLKSILDENFENALCPICRKNLSQPNIDQYVTSFDLLNLAESFNNMCINKEEFKSNTVSPLKKKLESLRETLSERITDLSECISVMEDMQNLDNENMDVNESTTVVNGIKKKLNSYLTNHAVCTTYVLDVIDKPTLCLKNFGSKGDYLREVYRKIERGEKVYVHERINNEDKVGKVEVFGNKIMVYSLSKQEKIYANATILLFQDMKKCMLSSRIYAFIKISCNEVVNDLFLIDLTEHGLVPQFLKLCTGESGCSYKDSKCRAYYSKQQEHQGKFQVPRYNNSERKEQREQIDFISGTNVLTSCKVGELTVAGFIDGCFHVSEVLNEVTYSNILGKILFPCETMHLFTKDADFTHKKIIDCGVIISLQSKAVN